MTTRKNVILFTVAALFVAVVIFYKWSSSIHVCHKFDCVIFPGIEKWIVKDTYSDTGEGWRGMISANDYNVRFSVAYNIDSAKALDLTKTTSMQINGLFDTAKNPYAGAISDKIVCPDSLKPVSENISTTSGVNIVYSRSYLNERMEYGACTESQITYKVFSGMFYCSKSKDWYEIELITPKYTDKSDEFYKNIFLGVECK